MKHYTLSIKSHASIEDYEDGIMAESLEDAIKMFQECLDLGIPAEEFKNYVTED